MWYWNAAGQRFALPERELESPDCWKEERHEREERRE